METGDRPVIQVKNLYKLYRVGDSYVRALNGVNLEIRKGEFCSIVGTSGSGKSTLLNMLAGLEKPTRGEIIIAGEHLENKTENQLVRFRREHIGFIFQSFNLLGTMNAVENVALPLTFQGVDREIRLKRASRLLDLVGLKEHKKHRPTQMSGGQQQRVGVARALVVNPEIIFADEPTGNLDSHTSKDVMELMQRVVREQKQTLVMVTHDNYLAGFATGSSISSTDRSFRSRTTGKTERRRRRKNRKREEGRAEHGPDRMEEKMNAGKMRGIIRSCLAAAAAVLILAQPAGAAGTVYATENEGEETVERSSDRLITDDDRFDADAQLKYHVDSILKRTNPDEYTLQKLNDTLYSAYYYIANNELSVSELWSYVSEMKGSWRPLCRMYP